MTKFINLKLINNFIIFEKQLKYLQYKKICSLLKIKTGNIVFVEFFYYDIFIIRKQFFLGICIATEKKKNTSSFILRNVLGGVLVEQKFLCYSPLIYTIKCSKKRNVILGKSKLYFILNLPFLFRINKFVLSEFIYLRKKKSK